MVKAEAKATATPLGTDLTTFEEAYLSYVRNLQEAQADLQKRLQDEHQRYLGLLAQPQTELQKVWSEAEQDLVKKAQELAGQAESGQQKLHEEHTKTSRMLQQLNTKVQESVAQVHKDFATTQEQVWQEAQSRSQQALRDYVRALKAAWEGLDPESCDPQMVALIGQSMLAVALPATSRPGF